MRAEWRGAGGGVWTRSRDRGGGDDGRGWTADARTTRGYFYSSSLAWVPSGVRRAGVARSWMDAGGRGAKPWKRVGCYAASRVEGRGAGRGFD